MAGLVANVHIGDGNWVSGSVLVNPADQTILADTGPLLPGNYIFAVTGGGNIAWVYDFQHRDSTNTITINTQRRFPAAGDDDVVVANKQPFQANERFRIILQGAIVGTVQMSIFYAQVT